MKNYIVLATKDNYLKAVIDCEQYCIKEYVKSLKFGEEVCLTFISIENLSTDNVIEPNTSLDKVYMSNSKSFDSFQSELNDLMENLGIKEVKEVDDED